MRITANLSLFFHDHRSLAKIFINENIKSIKDLENRISEIFKISNFYLKCENQYLPPSEDVHILNNDDIVWALPKSENHQSSEIDVFDDQVETEQIIERKKKKKKKHKEVITDDAEPIKINKKRKRDSEKSKLDRETSAESNIQCSEYTNDESKSKRKKFKSKSKIHDKVLPSVTISKDSISKDSGRDSFDSSKSDEVENQSLNVKSLVHSFESKSDLKKCLENSFTPIQKKTNIVKTIIISSNKCKTLNSEAADTNQSKSDLELPTTSSETSKLDSSPDTNEITQSNIDDGKDDQENNKETEFYDAFDANFVEKRRRKRTRKKKISNEDKFYLDYSNKPENNVVPKLLLTKTATGRHVRFKDGSDVIPSPGLITPDNGSITTKENDNEHKEACSEEFNTKEPKQVFNVTEVISNKELTEEVILKQPNMKNIQPRLGDIIAFKILRISENYTPEVSAWIVGKVSDYDVEKLEVTFDVMDGKEQCVQPQGKFSLDLEDENEPEEETDSAKFHCAWSSVLDPRLLYP